MFNRSSVRRSLKAAALTMQARTTRLMGICAAGVLTAVLGLTVVVPQASAVSRGYSRTCPGGVPWQLCNLTKTGRIFYVKGANRSGAFMACQIRSMTNATTASIGYGNGSCSTSLYGAGETAAIVRDQASTPDSGETLYMTVLL
ncbi:MAG TPA: hypothetical protein VGC59_10875 [Solirubrobacteraceae bacterium]